MTSRAVAAIGIGQCVNWGVLYYAFGVLLLPVERELGAPRWIVAGAFSVALLASAAAAPAVGRWADRGHGPAVMQTGGLVASALLATWAGWPHLAVHYGVWAGLGFCMAMALYEPAFAIVGRALDDATHRLRALAAITVFGGLASTVFLPATAALVQHAGWRGAVWTLAAVLAASTLLVSRAGFGGSSSALSAPRPAGAGASATRMTATRLTSHHELYPLTIVFACTSLASAGLTTNLIPLLVDRHASAPTAAWLAGLLGVMQLPGRALILNGRFTIAPTRLLAGSLLLQAAGLATLLLPPFLTVMALGVALFAAGAGLTTLVRPHLIQTFYGVEHAGHPNGRVARAQQLARAAGPVFTAGLAGASGGYAAFLGLFAVTLAVLAVSSLVAPLSVFRTQLAPGRRV